MSICLYMTSYHRRYERRIQDEAALEDHRICKNMFAEIVAGSDVGFSMIFGPSSFVQCCVVS